MPTGIAKKYQVGYIGRGHLAAITEAAMSCNAGSALVFLFSHRGKKYELRARRRPHGIDLAWGLPGTFFCPDGYDNQFTKGR